MATITCNRNEPTRLRVELVFATTQTSPTPQIRMVPHPYGWLSLLPPLVAIVLAIATRRILLSLLAGLFVGALVTTGGDPVTAISQTLELHLWKTVADESRLRVFAFTLLMGAMVGVMHRSGGMQGLVAWIAPLARSRRGGQLTTWALGLVIFFDDYANTILLGSTLRPLCDRLKISREKLAYLVDSTAAPIAGLALVSTWVAAEISFVEQGLDKVATPTDVSAFALFVASIPYRFYILWTVLFVGLVGWLGRDFGPMLRAEQRCVDGGATRSASIGPPPVTGDPLAATSTTTPRAVNALLPVAVTVGGILWLLYRTGRDALDGLAAPTDATWMQIFGNADANIALLYGSLAGLATAAALCTAQRLFSSAELIRAAGTGAAMMLPALAILWLASALAAMTGSQPVSGHTGDATAQQLHPAPWVSNAPTVGWVSNPSPFERGDASPSNVGWVCNPSPITQWVSNPSPVVARSPDRNTSPTEGLHSIHHPPLPLHSTSTAQAHANGGKAGGLQHTVSARDTRFPLPYRLYTTEYLSGILGDRLSAPLLPTVVFLLAAVTAFATGTSWGTMGILMPLVIPLTWSVSAPGAQPATDPILLGSIASVLAGAIFGDHCSPISDTTILSSQASGCDHLAHVWTQLPYALAVALVSILFGTLPVGYGAPVWLLFPLGPVALYILLRLVGRAVSSDT